MMRELDTQRKSVITLLGASQRLITLSNKFYQATYAAHWHGSINTIINISEDHVADDPTEDVATTILHELSHYDTSLGTDDIAYMYTMEEFEENIHGLTYGTAALNADSIAFLIRALAQL